VFKSTLSFTKGKVYKTMGVISAYNNIIIEFDDNGCTCTGFSKNHVVHATKEEYDKQNREPILTTEDGVEIFEGDRVDYVTVQLYSNFTFTTKGFMPKEHIRYFSTKEKAQEYIDNNKPVFSKQQVRDAINKTVNSGFNWYLNGTSIKEEFRNVFFKELGL
jgi:hypothetical protein